jgi:hypothetical protein
LFWGIHCRQSFDNQLGSFLDAATAVPERFEDIFIVLPRRDVAKAVIPAVDAKVIQNDKGNRINLLSERKLAKLIALVEELRRDLPIVRNRLDDEATDMAQGIDPIAVLTALEEAIQKETASVVIKGDISPNP